MKDMLGNLSEWVEDCWHVDYNGAPDDGAAWTLGGDCTERVIRGGHWIDFLTKDVSTTHRTGIAPTARRLNVMGFRVAMTLP